MSCLLYFPVPNFPPKLDVQYLLGHGRSFHARNLRTLKIGGQVLFSVAEEVSVINFGGKVEQLNS